MSSKMTLTEDNMEKLLRKLNYLVSTIEKMVSSAHSNSKIMIIKEKIEQLEELVLEIPDCCGDLFDQWMDKVVQQWEKYSAAASAAGHRPANGSATVAYPQPITSSLTANLSTNVQPSSLSTTNGTITSIATGISEKRSALHPRTVASNQQQNGNQSKQPNSSHHSKSTAKFARNVSSCSGDEHTRTFN